MMTSGLWRALNQPFTIWLLSAGLLAGLAVFWPRYDSAAEDRARATVEHGKLHTEFKSRLMTLREEVRDKVPAIEIRRSLETAASANVHPEMQNRSLASLGIEHDDIVASGQVHCPVSLKKAADEIYENLRADSTAGVVKTGSGVSAWLSRLGVGN